VASYLTRAHGFQKLTLDRPIGTPTLENNPLASLSPNGDSLPSFHNVQQLLAYVTENWQKDYVTTSIWSQEILEVLTNRPFFILLSVDAPISIRWKRFSERCRALDQTPPTLEQFVVQDDEHMYDPVYGLAALPSQARIKLLNSTTSLPQLWEALQKLDLTDHDRLRPSWDNYFMKLASLAARRSNCMRRSVGCVLVREKRVISTGYNGTPRNVTNCNQGGCPRCNSGAAGGSDLSTCRCIHAEENALLEAGRERVGDGAVLYCNTFVDHAHPGRAVHTDVLRQMPVPDL